MGFKGAQAKKKRFKVKARQRKLHKGLYGEVASEKTTLKHLKLKTCGLKHYYPSMREAREACDEEPEKHLAPYKCPFCPGFHRAYKGVEVGPKL